MKRYNLSIKDIQKNYFHFTWKINLENIEKYGLIPQKGKHAQYVEDSKKVFFVQGLDNLLILFDCWITIYKKKPLILLSKKSKSIGAKALRLRLFPSFLIDLYFILIRNSKRHKKNAYKVFEQILEDCVLLKLDIKAGEDFSFLDTDEIKSSSYRKRHLIELGYSEKYSNMSVNTMDKWNLHTFRNKGITSNKVKLCQISKSSSLKDIVAYALKNTTIDIKDICPTLYDYITYKNLSF